MLPETMVAVFTSAHEPEIRLRRQYSFPTRRSSDLPSTTPSCSSSRATRRACCRSANWNSTPSRSEEHTSELQSQIQLVCSLLTEKKIGRIEHHQTSTPTNCECCPRHW